MAGRCWAVGFSLGAFLVFAIALQPRPAVVPGHRALRDRLVDERAAALRDPRMQPLWTGRAIALRHDSGTAARIDEHGAAIALGANTGLQLALSSIERSDGSVVVAGPRAAVPQVLGAEVAREVTPGVFEWWRSIASGLEHGVTLATRPRGDGDLIVKLALEGASARAASASAVELLDGDGALIGHYGDLLVTDAGGAILNASMSVDRDRVRIDIEDRGARYPIVVDPLLTAAEARFFGELGPLNERLGTAVALSADGTRALVSAPGAVDGMLPNDLYAGDSTVIVLVRSGGSWVEETRLIVEAEGPSVAFGVVLALSEDGSVALIGQPSVAGGCARVFTRDGSTWTESALLTAVGSEPLDQFGSAVALSLDGNVALIGAPGANVATGHEPFGGEGLAYVFERVASEWIQRSTLEAPVPTPSQSFGAAVALSGDGSVALAGAFYADPFVDFEGSAYVFERDGDVWLETATLVRADASALDMFGSSVALSAAGDVALVGAPGDEDGAGSAHMFERDATTWTEVAALKGPDPAIAGNLGSTVALSADGTRALIGAPMYYIPSTDTASGSVLPATRIGGTWTSGSMLCLSEPQYNERFGDAVSLSGDGALAMIGMPFAKLEGTVTEVGAVAFYEDDASSYVPDRQLMLEPEWVELDLGAAVALTPTGDRALLGAPGTQINGDARVGQARVLRRDGRQWAIEARLRASDGEAGDAFGSALAVSAAGDMALIGASFDDTADGTDAGSVRVFVRQDSAWTAQQTLLAPDGAAGDSFGSAVALSHDGQYAIIGAPGKDQDAMERGRAYVFVRTAGAFAFDSAITLSGASVGEIGIAVAIDGAGTRAIVNARSSASNQYAPRVLVRDGSSWSVETVLSPESLAGHVGLSTDGDRAFNGRSIFVRDGSAWSSETPGSMGVVFGISGDGTRAATLWTGRVNQRLIVFYEREARGWIASRATLAHFSIPAAAAMTSHGDRALIGQALGGQGRGIATLYTLTHFDSPNPCDDTDCDAGVDEEPDAALPDPLDAAIRDDAGPRDSGLPDAAAPDAAMPDASTTADAAVTPDAAQPMPNDGDASVPGPDVLTSSCSCRVVRADGGRAPYAWGLLMAGLLVLGVLRRKIDWSRGRLD